MAAISAEGVVGHDNKILPTEKHAVNAVVPVAEMLCRAMNIDMNPSCELQRPDMNFFEVCIQS
jgi:hypothetical protein